MGQRIPRIGLTGGIGSGKSVVAERFAALGVPVIEADQITRNLCLPDAPALAQIVATFGSEILNTNGSLNRTALRTKIFADHKARRNLEAILHPGVHDEMLRWCQTLTLQFNYAILVIPLLLENRWLLSLVDRTLVVDCPEELQLQRVMARDHVNRTWAESVLAVQISRQARLAEADDVLVNDGDLVTLDRLVGEQHQLYLEWIGC